MTINSNIQEYLDIVRSGTIPMCKEQFLLADYVDKVFREEQLYVDEKQLEEYLALQKYFPYSLLPWEKFCFALHNCVYRSDGQLRWPILFIYVGRGSGKNGYLAFEDFALLTPVNPVEKYHIDIFATAEDQAKMTFDDIYNILEDNKIKMKKHFYWSKEIIRNLETKSQLRFRTSNAKSKDGGRPGKVDFDEYHAYEHYRLINVATTGLGKKLHPRRTIISTDGDVRDGPLDNLKERSLLILRGEAEDNGLLPFLCRLDNDNEIVKKECWPKATPSLVYFKHLQHEMEIEFGDYLLDPIGNSAFATKRMNRPQGDKDVEVTSWDNILATNQEIPDLTGKCAVWGIDYANINDFIAAGILIKVGEFYYWISHTWVCRNSKDLSRIQYPLEQAEVRQLLTFVDGVEIDPEIPVLWLKEQQSKYSLVMGGIDKYRHLQMQRALNAAGFDGNLKSGNLKIVRPSDQMLISPIITSAFANHKIIWGDNSLMRWYTNNAKRSVDPKGNVSYEKIDPKSRKTDGFMAFVAAMCCESVLNGEDYDDSLNFGCFTF